MLVGRVHVAPDFIAPDVAQTICRSLPPSVASVLVTHVDDADGVMRLADVAACQVVQLHSDLDVSVLEELRHRLSPRKVIGKVSVEDDRAVNRAREIAPFVDAIVLARMRIACGASWPRPPWPAMWRLGHRSRFDLGGRMSWRVVFLALAVVGLPRRALAQRAAVPDDFPGITRCEGSRAVTRIRTDVRDSLLLAQLEAHEAVHRAQAAGYPTCQAFLAGLRTARQVIDVELPAYCAQWRVAVAQGAEPVETRREFSWRIAAESGAMENRLQVVQRFESECAPAVPAGQSAGRATRPPVADEGR